MSSEPELPKPRRAIPRWAWQRRKEELREELEAHLRLAIADRVARGEDPEAARAAALKEMGNVPLIADVTRRQWGWEWAEQLWQDLRYALRQLRKSPGYTATALLTLTLAIGANTAIFSLMYALLLRSLPVYQPDRLVQIGLKIGPANWAREPNDTVSGGIYDALADRQTAFSGLCLWSSWSLNLRDQNGTRPVHSALVTGGCFQTLGVHAALGRLIVPADDHPGGGPEGYPVVLGYDYWQARYGGDPRVLGQTLTFGSGPGNIEAKGIVIGVMEPGFGGIVVGERPWIYAPSEMETKEARHGLSEGGQLIARLRDDTPLSQAQAQIDPLFQAKLKAENYQYGISDPSSPGTIRFTRDAHLVVSRARTGFSDLRGDYSKPLWLIEGMVGLSLLVACAYLATLSSTRALVRRREIALRIALGVSRARVMRQLCCESLLVAIVGGTCGIFFAWVSAHLLLDFLASPGGDAPALDVTPGGIVLLFTLAASLFTVLIAGVAPAWRATKVDPASDIKRGESSFSGYGVALPGSWLIPIQTGFSLTIIVIAALMASTVARLLSVHPGFSTSGTTFFQVDFSPLAKHGDVPLTTVTTMLDRIRQSPGVESASISEAHPIQGYVYLQSASSTDASGAMRSDPMLANVATSPGYFNTLGIPLLAGRDFTAADEGGSPPVCILSRSAADYFFPGKNALGRTLRLNNGKTHPDAQVIGISGDILNANLRGDAWRTVYQPYLYKAAWRTRGQISVRAATTSIAVEVVQAAFRQMAPDIALGRPATISEFIDSSIGRERMMAVLSSFFAILTLALTGIGLYGLLSYAVVRRRPEIGVRMALGASPASVVRMIARDAARLVLPGLLLGAIGAWASTRLLGSLLFGVKPLDPAMCIVSVLLLAIAVTMACVLPARRAASVQPMEALRRE